LPTTGQVPEPTTLNVPGNPNADGYNFPGQPSNPAIDAENVPHDTFGLGGGGWW
jgi:hypothetical protein